MLDTNLVKSGLQKSIGASFMGVSLSQMTHDELLAVTAILAEDYTKKQKLMEHEEILHRTRALEQAVIVHRGATFEGRAITQLAKDFYGFLANKKDFSEEKAA